LREQTKNLDCKSRKDFNAQTKYSKDHLDSLAHYEKTAGSLEEKKPEIIEYKKHGKKRHLKTYFVRAGS
jgi:hypothetical protein